VESQLNNFKTKAPQGGLVLRLGYFGLDRKVNDLFVKKKSRVLLMTAENPRPEFDAHLLYKDRIDLGYAFGDACVQIDGYPIPLFPPSGIVKAVTYECLNLEVLSLLGK
jgi:hypothetical protein